jgi:hypothetical protein
MKRMTEMGAVAMLFVEPLMGAIRFCWRGPQAKSIMLPPVEMTPTLSWGVFYLRLSDK